MEIDRREPNPMKDPVDISVYNNKIQEQRLYQLLMAVDDMFKVIKRELLKKEPLPLHEVAYAAIRREEGRMDILKGNPSEYIDSSLGIGSGLRIQ